MKKYNDPERQAKLAASFESFLKDHGFCYSRQTIAKRNRDIFDIICDTDESDLTEQHISAYVHDDLIFIEAAVPVVSNDKSKTATLINELNIENPIGTFQYDIRDGELNWTHFLPSYNGQRTGDTMLCEVLNRSKQMAALLYQSLLSTDPAYTNIAD